MKCFYYFVDGGKVFVILDSLRNPVGMTQSWLGMTKEQMDKMELIFKKNIQKIISLRKPTNYKVLLHKVSNIHIEQ